MQVVTCAEWDHKVIIGGKLAVRGSARTLLEAKRAAAPDCRIAVLRETRRMV
jgi:hypothetical protein